MDGKKVVTNEMLEERLKNFHRSRWRGISIWITIFTVLVFFALWKQRTDNAQRSKDRTAQIQVIVDAGHQECVHSFMALTTILNIVFPAEQIKTLKQAQQDRIQTIFDAADPKLQCPPSTLTPEQKKAIDKAKKGNK